MNRDPINCLHSWADELSAKANRVRNLIGDAHWLSDGHHKEDIVREFLRRHLPPSLRISRGFICPSDPAARVSPEIDILISDAEAELPWFSEGGLTIVAPSAARGHLHVKTELGTTELKDVLDSTRAVYESCASDREVTSLWAGALFFSSIHADTPEKATTILWKTIKAHVENYTPSDFAATLPDCIGILGGPVLLMDKQKLKRREDLPDSVRIFDCNGLSIAILLSHFYDSVREKGRPPHRRGVWARLLQGGQYRLLTLPAA